MKEKKYKFSDIAFFIIDKKLDVLLQKKILSKKQKNEYEYLKSKWIELMNKQELNAYKVYKLKFNERITKQYYKMGKG